MTNYRNEVATAAAKYPDAWKNAHNDGPNTEDFIRLLAADLHALDPNVGLNGKRGNANDISDDALAVFDPAGDVTDRTGKKMFIIDCIGGAGGPDPQPVWNSVGGPSPGAWVKPEPATGKPPVPKPPPKPVVKPYPGDAVWDAIGAQVFADYNAAGRKPDPQMFRWAGRVTWDATAGDETGRVYTIQESIDAHRPEWLAELGR